METSPDRPVLGVDNASDLSRGHIFVDLLDSGELLLAAADHTGMCLSRGVYTLQEFNRIVESARRQILRRYGAESAEALGL